jgi:hypothetical protein
VRPKTGFTGTVAISYTGVDEDGDSYTGTVNITVPARSNTGFLYHIQKIVRHLPKPSDFETVCEPGATGEDLDYVKFTLPSPLSYGKTLL